MIFFLLILHVVSADIKGPPHIIGSLTPKQTFRLGETIKLDCPIRGIPTPIVEWYKDGDSVAAGWERFKMTNHGLRIKEVILDDSGEYTCKGVNGFGSEQVTFEIVIIDPNAKATDPPSSDLNTDDNDDLVTWRKISRPGSGSAPLLVETSHIPAGRHWQLPVDSTLRLKCVAQGEPEPHLIWLKDGKEIGDERRMGRWELQVTHLNLDDSGLYTCKAVNPYGSINASFNIQVFDRSLRKPEFVGVYPQNVTIVEGSTARLQCRVISDTPLFLQWLKRLERVPYETQEHGRPDHDGILNFEGWKYRIVRSGSPAFQVDDGSYLDKLALDDAGLGHAGVYICVATNTAGYTYREALVNVIPGSGRALADLSSSGLGNNGLPTAAVIALPVGAFAVLALSGWIIYYFKSERRRRATKQQRHQDVKDLTTPCLPRTDALTLAPEPIHHRYPAPYSTPFMGTIQQQELLRQQQRQIRNCHSPLIGTATTSSGSNAPLYPSNWSFRQPPCGRPERYGYHHEPPMMVPPPPPSDSEHAYASVHGVNYERPATIVGRNNRFQRIEML